MPILKLTTERCVMIDYDSDRFDAIAIEEERQRRVWERKILAHPDCRDPDHPGCSSCDEEEQ